MVEIPNRFFFFYQRSFEKCLALGSLLGDILFNVLN